MNLWKGLVDSLVPLLGRRPSKGEFDIEDGRITSLCLRRGNRIDLNSRGDRRPLTPAAGPLTYDPAPMTSRSKVAPTSEPAEAPARLGQSSRPGDADVVEILTIDEFSAIQSRGRGCVINRDSSGTTIHEAGCTSVNETTFHAKVIAGERKGGRYFYAASQEAALTRWPNARDCGNCLNKC